MPEAEGFTKSYYGTFLRSGDDGRCVVETEQECGDAISAEIDKLERECECYGPHVSDLPANLIIRMTLLGLLIARLNRDVDGLPILSNRLLHAELKTRA